VNENNLIVVDQISFEKPKTKDMVKLLEALKVNKKALLVVENNDTNAYVSARNIQGVLIARPESLNVYDLLKHDFVVFSKAAVIKAEEVLSNA
jgi:large subunit ribosomal protein L4